MVQKSFNILCLESSYFHANKLLIVGHTVVYQMWVIMKPELRETSQYRSKTTSPFVEKLDSHSAMDMTFVRLISICSKKESHTYITKANAHGTENIDTSKEYKC
jgi:hypothetical protein